MIRYAGKHSTTPPEPTVRPGPPLISPLFCLTFHSSLRKSRADRAWAVPLWNVGCWWVIIGTSDQYPIAKCQWQIRQVQFDRANSSVPAQRPKKWAHSPLAIDADTAAPPPTAASPSTTTTAPIVLRKLLHGARATPATTTTTTSSTEWGDGVDRGDTEARDWNPQT